MTDPAFHAYTPEDVAQHLQIAKHTVYELVKRGELSAYRVGNKMRIDPQDLANYKLNMKKDLQQKYNISTDPQEWQKVKRGEGSLTLVGSHDFLVEELTRSMNKMTPSVLLHSSYLGSLEGLLMLYHKKADIAAVHMKDPHTGEYNLPFIQRFFIHEPISVVRLADRTQGFMVQKGNPKQIHSWIDLTRDDVRFINRQKGSGTRYLLDASLAKERIFPAQINGYGRVSWTHTDTAAAVASGRADVALGVQAAADQLHLTFVPLATESFDLVCRWQSSNGDTLQRVIDYVQSEQLRASMPSLAGYDYTRMGEIVYAIKGDQQGKHTAS